jgi:transposase-like protein
MAKRGHSEGAILRLLRETDSGETAVEICRKHGISQQTFYLWKKKYAGLGLSELRELRQLVAIEYGLCRSVRAGSTAGRVVGFGAW